MFKKVGFSSLNYKDLERVDDHDIRRDNLHHLYTTFDFFELLKKWPLIVGDKMSRVTSPLKIKGDTLMIITHHSSYSHELSYLGEEIKKQIFLQLPELRPYIKKLHFMTMETFFTQKQELANSPISKQKLHPQNPIYKIKKLEAEKIFKDIEDEEIRQSLISIFIQAF